MVIFNSYVSLPEGTYDITCEITYDDDIPQPVLAAENVPAAARRFGLWLQPTTTALKKMVRVAPNRWEWCNSVIDDKGVCDYV